MNNNIERVMGRNYRKEARAPGATPEEKISLKKLIGTDIIKIIKRDRISKDSYYKFLRGEEVAAFVRQKIMGAVQEICKDLEGMAQKSRDK